MTDDVGDKFSAIDTRLSAVETKVSSEKAFAEVAAEKVESAASDVQNAAKLFSEVAGAQNAPAIGMLPNTTSPTIKSKESFVFLNPDDSGSSKSVDEVVAAVSRQLKTVPTSYIRTNDTTKQVTVAFPDVETRDIGSQSIDDDQLSALGYTKKNSKKMLPKLMIEGVHSYIFDGIDFDDMEEADVRSAKKSRIINLIMDKNPSVSTLVEQNHTLECIYLTEDDDSKRLSVGIKVSPAIRLAIIEKQGSALFIGIRKYAIKDRYYIDTCYHCQLVGHKSTNCPSARQDPVCLYCMGSHRSKNCRVKSNRRVHCCAKCYYSNNPKFRAEYKTHNSSSFDCPVLKQARERVENNTDRESKNPM